MLKLEFKECDNIYNKKNINKSEIIYFKINKGRGVN